MSSPGNSVTFKKKRNYKGPPPLFIPTVTTAFPLACVCACVCVRVFCLVLVACACRPSSDRWRQRIMALIVLWWLFVCMEDSRYWRESLEWLRTPLRPLDSGGIRAAAIFTEIPENGAAHRPTPSTLINQYARNMAGHSHLISILVTGMDFLANTHHCVIQ